VHLQQFVTLDSFSLLVQNFAWPVLPTVEQTCWMLLDMMLICKVYQCHEMASENQTKIKVQKIK